MIGRAPSMNWIRIICGVWCRKYLQNSELKLDGNNKMGTRGIMKKCIQNFACLHLNGRDYLEMKACMGG
jgi:hypothetical protein